MMFIINSLMAIIICLGLWLIVMDLLVAAVEGAILKVEGYTMLTVSLS